MPDVSAHGWAQKAVPCTALCGAEAQAGGDSCSKAHLPRVTGNSRFHRMTVPKPGATTRTKCRCERSPHSKLSEKCRCIAIKSASARAKLLWKTRLLDDVQQLE
ncbi:hypothetical protein MRX96_012245 [Rhipicephalus microplus]